LSSRGFTLLEMLVTLALMALVSALLWQAMGQVLRVERLLQRSGLDGQLETVKREWVRALIESSATERFGVANEFAGDGGRLNLESMEAFNFLGLNAASVQLRIESDPADERHRLLLEDRPARPGDAIAPGGPQTARPSIELLAWRGTAGSFRYLDELGQWQDHWPVAPTFVADKKANDDDLLRASRAAAPRLPKAVWLSVGGDAGGPLIVAVGVTEHGRPRLAQLEQL
jgi:prepilin-type N-terminal cleavage/methylation domain-containing protein